MKANASFYRRPPRNHGPASTTPPKPSISDLPLVEPEQTSIISILSMNEARDTQKWDALTKDVKSRVVKPRRVGLTIPSYPSFDEDEDMYLGSPTEEERPMTAEDRIKIRLEIQAKRDYVASHVPLTVADMKPFDQPDIQSNFCFKCWMLVAAPPVGLSCQYCPVIAHRHCVEILQVSAKNKLSKIRRSMSSMESSDGDSSDSDNDTAVRTVTSQSAMKDITPEEMNMQWVCPFCIETLHDHNDYKNSKATQARRIIQERKTSTSMGATARMFVARKRWIARVKNSIKIQRFMRARAMMAALRDELRAAKNVVRIGLHEIQLRLVLSGIDPDPEEYTLFRKVGQFGSVMMQKYLANPPPSRPELKTAIDVLRGCITSPPVHLRPAEKAVSSRSLMLTVTVHDMLDAEKQIYRLDTPLVETVRKRKAHTRIKRVYGGGGDSDDENSVGSLTEATDDITIMSNSTEATRKNPLLKQLYFKPQSRGVMVFPACHADIVIRLTVSEVSKWPNSVALARAELQVTDYVLKRHAMVVTQRLEEVNRADRPIEQAPSGRLNVANYRNARAEPSRFILGHGKITWAFIPATGASTMAGPLLLLPDYDSWGAKKRTWCAIIDRVLYIYSAASDVVAKEVVDLANCKVMMHDNEVIELERMYGTRKSLFAYCSHQNQRTLWWGQISQAGQLKASFTNNISRSDIVESDDDSKQAPALAPRRAPPLGRGMSTKKLK